MKSKMNDTKENILYTALHLFANNGFDAVSVSDIAGELGITKGALYKHYKNKRDIFNCILSRMEETDRERAQLFDVPTGTFHEMKEAYRNATIRQLEAFALAQFTYWTKEDFPSSFRRTLTLEQFRSAEMSSLYQQYLVSGPLGYVTDIFSSWGIKSAQSKAIELCAPMFLYYSIYDGTQDKEAAIAAIEKHIHLFFKEWRAAK